MFLFDVHSKVVYGEEKMAPMSIPEWLRRSKKILRLYFSHADFCVFYLSCNRSQFFHIWSIRNDAILY